MAYTSQQLKKHENNYETRDLELDIMGFSLKIWHHCLYGEHYNIFTDHKSLQYTFKQREMNLIQIRWLEQLKYYDSNILYHLGKANIVVDDLSHKYMGTLTYLNVYFQVLVFCISSFSFSSIAYRYVGILILIKCLFMLCQSLYRLIESSMFIHDVNLANPSIYQIFPFGSNES